jgi:alpha-beta hydrolase superfamily lysophospholipase
MAKEFFQLSDADNRKLNAYCWMPENDPLAVVAIIHGLGDHIGRYAYLSEFFNFNGIATIGMDYQGHGKSPGKRGHIRSFDVLMSNVEKLLIETRLRNIDIPLFLYGHSLGGNIVANFTLRHQSKEIAGVILSSPFLQLAFNPPKWKIKIAKILGNLFPSVTLSNEIDPMELSHDPFVGKAYMEDPLVHEKVSFKLYNIATENGFWALNNAHLLNYPALLIHGDEDRLTSHLATEKFAGKAGPKATLKIWKGLRHELHNEKSKDEVLNHICKWIKEIIEK